MSRLRVAIVIPGFVEARDDPGLPAVVDLVARIAAAHDTHVVALRHPPARPLYRVAGATVHALGGGRAAGPSGRAALLARGLLALLRIHRQRPLDLVHAFWADEAGAVAALAARMIGRPAIVSVMGGELVRLADIGYGAALGRGGRLTAALALRQAALVTCGSTTIRELVLARAPRATVELLPLGVDTTAFSPAGEPARGVPRILFVGGLEPVKDPQMLIRAFADLAGSHPDARLDIVGQGSLQAEIRRLAAELGIGERVTFRGQLPRGALPEVYRAASVLAVSSRHEAQSMVAIEAAACGVPVVGTRVGALPDLSHGALTVPVGDRAGLARALATVLDDPVLAASMGVAGRAVVVERFDIRRTADELLERYAGLVTGPRRRRRADST